MKTLKCPDCGRLIAARFPMHECAKPKRTSKSSIHNPTKGFLLNQVGPKGFLP